MHKASILLGILLMAAVFFAGFIYVSNSTSENTKAKVPEEITQVVSQVPGKDQVKSPYFYPMTDYFNRITVREFGRRVVGSDAKALPCGSQFSGFHDADDLETFDGERDIDVPVFAVAGGKIVRLGYINGYGGLLVQSANLADDPVTIYYGHINLASVSKKVGDDLTAGDQIALLGKGCSTETDGERKHLHFAIKKGTSIDVRGYVPSQPVLTDWFNPGEELKKLTSSNPE